MAENQVEEADRMLQSDHPEYRIRVHMVLEAQKTVSSLKKTQKLKKAIDSYADAINGRWLMFSKLLYQYSIENLLSTH